MKKGGDHIEADFFQYLTNSPLVTFIKGKLYRDGKRPLNADTEDAIVIFKTALDGQYQDGEVVLNIFVPDIPSDGTHQKDIARCREIGNEIMEIIDTFTNSEYLIKLHNVPVTYEAEGLKQHYVNARIRFKRRTF